MRFFAMYDSLPSKIAAGSLNCQSCSAQSGFHIETARFRLIQHDRNHPVPTVPVTAQPGRREDPYAAARPFNSGAGVFHDNASLGSNADSGSD
jgi:hypothetical protein